MYLKRDVTLSDVCCTDILSPLKRMKCVFQCALVLLHTCPTVSESYHFNLPEFCSVHSEVSMMLWKLVSTLPARELKRLCGTGHSQPPGSCPVDMRPTAGGCLPKEG